jgi:hypothetical protein
VPCFISRASLSMLFEIEFFHVTEAAPEGATIGRICRDFESLKTAEDHILSSAGISNSSHEVDGFRIHAAGRLKNTVYIRLERSRG